ncbi:PEP-CTERM sorting domain-containing protein [Aeoliella sp. SH292]|uniref:PEP-CTERM sorting domain-containing protein n=1 Tax=Aeoliella sp. SH292 TaxID=3454464 RepID=UPI003F9762A8
MDGPFEDLVPGTVIAGSFTVTAEHAIGQSLTYSFSAAIPEPSSVVLSGIAAIGLAFFARRRAA